MSLRKIITASLSIGLMSFPAYAYIDPGTGSVVLQAIIASVIAGAATATATARLWWDKFLCFFNIKKENKTSNPSISSEEDRPN